MQDVPQSIGGQVENRHTNGEISIIRISTAGMGARRVGIANLPPEVSHGVLHTVLSNYGEVRDIQMGTWSGLFRYLVANGIRLAKVTITTHIPSHITVNAHRVVVSYVGKPMTYYGYYETGHLHQACPMRR